MRNVHLSEEDIQQFALAQQAGSSETAKHIQQCDSCRVKAEMYRALFADVDLLPQPAFGFDLTALVMDQLPQPAPKVSKGESWVYGFAAIAILSIGSALYPFGVYLSNLFTGLSAMTIILVATTTVLLLLFLGMDLYFSYKKQLKRLNFQ